MSSPLPPMVHHPRHADENPTVLTIRRVEAADANGNRSIFGENAGRVSFGSIDTRRSNFEQTESAAFTSAEKLGFSTVESSTFRESTEKPSRGEGDNPELGSRGHISGLHQADNVEREVKWEESRLGFGAGGYGAGSGAGGKLRSVHRGNKRTPYDRPATGRHATAGGSAAMAAASLSRKLTVASRIRDSASRFIYSSASYVFSTLFKHAPPSVKAYGESKCTGVGIAVDEEMCKEVQKTPVKQIEKTSGPRSASRVPELVDADGKCMEAEARVLDIMQIEEILKQKTWSREQVNRLTQILQTRVSENDVANPIAEEAEKTEVQPKLKAKDSSPVQVARAYMGEQATRASGIAATARKSSFLSTEVQPSPVRTLENRYLSSPFSRSWARNSPAVRMPKRSLAREDDLASIGPVRRVRQKTSILASGNPYSWHMTALNKPLESRTSSPPSQSSQIALKILETLEKLSPSPRGKFLEGSPEQSTSGLQSLEKFSPTGKGKFLNEIVGVAGASTSEQTPESSKARQKVLAQNPSSVPSPKSTELKSIGKISFAGMDLRNSEPFKKSVVEAPSSISESYNSIPVLGKGFRMNAVFEESNSDEEAKLQAKLHAFTESRVRTSPHNVKEKATATSDSVVSSTAADLPGSFLLDPIQASTQPVLMLKSCSGPATPSLPDKPEPSVTAVSQEGVASFPSFSLPPVAVEIRPTLSGEAASPPAAAAEVKLSVEKVLKVPNSAGVKPASASLFARPTEALEMTTASRALTVFSSTSSEFAVTTVPLLASVGTTAPASSGNASEEAVNVFLSPIPMTSKTYMDDPEAENAVTMATESPVSEKLTEVDTMATDSMAEEVDTSTLALPASPLPFFSSDANVEPSTESTFSFAAGVSRTPSSATTLPFGSVLGTASSGLSASPSSSFIFGRLSSMASVGGQASNSIIGGASSFPSAAFTFGGQSSNASVEHVPTFAMGVSALSSSATSFAFGGQSGKTLVDQVPSLVANTSGLFDQSGTGSTGQSSSFGAMPSSPANPFSLTASSLSSPFMFGSSTATAFSSSAAPAFGSSAASSTSSEFTLSSSRPPSFRASSKFQFGALAGSTLSAPLSYIATNSFTTSPFSSSPAPTLSATSISSFGSSAVSSSSAGSATSGSLFAFGAAQSNPFAVNAVSLSGTQNSAPTFNFGAAATPSPFSSSAFPTSMFASNAAPETSNFFVFGSNSAPSTSSSFAFGSGQPVPVPAPAPAPFAFGVQPAAVPPASGQPFGFGRGQPAAPAQNPFSAAGTTQPGPGFALGATSGDKSGRKYIKAKRMGGTKRGK